MFVDYIKRNQELQPLFCHYPDLQGVFSALKEKKTDSSIRNILCDSLLFQYQHIRELRDAVKSSILSLRHETTFTVTTGHQLCLFTGPLYVIYKIISTINLSVELKKEYPDYTFVPIFWMATEDHDFEEINSVRIFGQKFAWENYQKGAVGEYNTQGIAPLITHLQELAQNSPYLKELIQIFEQAYAESTLANATRFLINYLFESHGLVVVDGNDKRLKSLLKEEMKQELFQESVCNNGLKTNELISSLGYKPQINPREINLFYLKPNFRERIIKEGGYYQILNSDIKFTRQEIEQEIENYPERFSPNVFFRALYQEKILPNIAYVAGPSELCYWLQMKNMFKAFNIPFPVIFPRNSLLWIDRNSATRLKKHNISVEDIFKPLHQLLETVVQDKSDKSLSLENEKEQLMCLFEKIKKKAIEVNSSLEISVESEKTKAIRAIETLEAKLIKEEKKNQEITVRQITSIKEKLFPNNNLQEREENIMFLYNQYGKVVLNDLLNILQPFSHKFILFSKN